MAFHAPNSALDVLKDILPAHVAAECVSPDGAYPPGVAYSNYGQWYDLSTKDKLGFFPLPVAASGMDAWEPFYICKRIEANGVSVDNIFIDSTCFV